MKKIACLLSLALLLVIGQTASAHEHGGLGGRGFGFNAGLGGNCGNVAAVPSFGFQQQAFLMQGVAPLPVVAQPSVIVLNQRAAFGGLGAVDPFLGSAFLGRGLGGRGFGFGAAIGFGGRGIHHAGLNRNFAAGRGIPRLKR